MVVACAQRMLYVGRLTCLKNMQQADPGIVSRIVRTHQSAGQVGSYEIVETLIVYYQMVSCTQQVMLCMLRCS